MSDPGRNAGERLEHMLAALPQDIEPQRDLWPDIAAQIEAGRGSVAAGSRHPIRS